jgi:hypothetical protein
MTTYITTEFTGQSDIRPRRVKIKTTDSFAVITAAGYLNKFQAQGYSFYPDDFLDVSYGNNISQTFTLSIANNGTITLAPLNVGILSGRGTFAGGSASTSFAVPGLTTHSRGSAVINTSTNAVSIVKSQPIDDELVIVFSADPGADTTIDYIYSIVAISV